MSPEKRGTVIGPASVPFPPPPITRRERMDVEGSAQYRL